MDKVELPLLKGRDREKCIPFAVVVGVIVLVVILSITFLSLTFKKDYKLHYSEKSNLDYKVYLKENNFYKESYLGKDQMYVASLIDYIDADFDYTFKSEEEIGLEYSYYIDAALVVNDVNGTKIYETKDTLVSNKKFTDLSNNTFKVDENIKIDYAKYNKIAKNFINEYGITAESRLLINLYVDLQGKHGDFDKKISNKSVMSLEVPLTNKTLEISLDYDLSNNTDEILQYKAAIINNPVVFKITIVLAVLDIIAIVVVVLLIIKFRDPAIKYEKRLQKILKDYSRYITETVITERAEDLMRTLSLRIEIVKSFEGLMDIRDNLGKQILYHEERPGEEAIFYIITDRTGYIYMMRVSDFK